MGDIYVVGVGTTRFGRLPDESVKSLTKQAVAASLSGGGCIRRSSRGHDRHFRRTRRHLPGQHRPVQAKAYLFLESFPRATTERFSRPNCCPAWPARIVRRDARELR